MSKISIIFLNGINDENSGKTTGDNGCDHDEDEPNTR